MENQEPKKARGKDYLADVFRVWDCNEQHWIDSSPVLLRFEEEDVLAWKEDGRVVMRTGPVSTRSDPSGAFPAHPQGRWDCTCWLHDDEYDGLIGGLWNVAGLAKRLTGL